MVSVSKGTKPAHTDDERNSAFPRETGGPRRRRCYQRTIVLSGAQRVGGASAEGHANRENRGSARNKMESRKIQSSLKWVETDEDGHEHDRRRRSRPWDLRSLESFSASRADPIRAGGFTASGRCGTYGTIAMARENGRREVYFMNRETKVGGGSSEGEGGRRRSEERRELGRGRRQRLL